MQQARDFADSLIGRREQLERELATLERQKSVIEPQLEAARSATDRYATFEPEIDRNLQCPRCWICDGTRASLRSIPGSESEDVFRCNKCEHEYHDRFR